MKRIIVTGATSMIGSAVIRSSLLHSVERIYAVIRPGSKNRSHLPIDSRITVVECNVTELDRLPELIPEACDTFYHIAWGLTGSARNKDTAAQAANVIYTITAVKAAAALGCSRFIGAGSQAEYGSVPQSASTGIGPDTPVNPVQPYGIAKYAAGKLARQEAALQGIECSWVRIFSVYGPYDKPTTMISATLRKMAAGEHTAFTEGTQIWDYLYADDAGEAFVRIGECESVSEVYCLGSGEGLPLREYILTMRDLVHPGLEIGLGEIPYGAGGPLSICADISALAADTGWAPRTSFSDGILKTLQFIKGNES